jgi:hypothetical protein
LLKWWAAVAVVLVEQRTEPLVEMGLLVEIPLLVQELPVLVAVAVLVFILGAQAAQLHLLLV